MRKTRLFFPDFRTLKSRRRDNSIEVRDAPGLHVVPYVKGRLVFAEKAAHAVLEGEFARVFVDLPAFMQERGWLDETLRHFPRLTTLLIRTGEGAFVSIPFSPSDAACLAASLAMDPGRKGGPIPVECVDDSNVIHYPRECWTAAPLAMEDDYHIWTAGFERYCDGLFERLDAQWPALSDAQRYFMDMRARRVAKRIKAAAAANVRTLFVCEFRLWWMVRKLLLDAEPQVSTPHFQVAWSDVDAALLLADPAKLWARGLLDDYPAVVNAFHWSLKAGRLQKFDKLEALQNLILDSMDKDTCRRKGVRIDVAGAVRFVQYLNRLLIWMRRTEDRVTPLPAAHMNRAAKGVCGEDFATHMMRLLFEYPGWREVDLLEYFSISEDQIRSLGGEGFPWPDLQGGNVTHPYDPGATMDRGQGSDPEALDAFVMDLWPELTPEEKEELKRDRNGVMWTLESDFRDRNAACHNVLRGVQRDLERVVPRKSAGSLEKGIHWRATLQSKAAGENAFYVRHRPREDRRSPLRRLGIYTPIVFLFKTMVEPSDEEGSVFDGNWAYRKILLGDPKLPSRDGEAPDHVYSLYYTCRHTLYMLDGHLRRCELTSLALLCSRHIRGPERHAAIMRQPRSLQCRVNPTTDPALQSFPKAERAVAWAVKYAEDVVLVVAERPWRQSQRLKSFAAQRRISILPLRSDLLPGETFMSIGRLHLITTPLKKHTKRDDILRRFRR